MTDKSDWESLEKQFTKAKDYLTLKTNIPSSWAFIGYNDPGFFTQETKEEKKDGKLERYVSVTFHRVVDLDDQEDQRVKRFTTSSQKLCGKLRGFFEHDQFNLEITRTGEDFQTDYEIYPISNKKPMTTAPEGTHAADPEETSESNV